MKGVLQLLLGILVLTGCATEPQKIYLTQYEVLVPSKMEVPEVPNLIKYDTKYGLDHPKNFRAFQTNQLLESDYIISLQNTIKFYENQIDKCNQEKESLESKNKE